MNPKLLLWLLTATLLVFCAAAEAQQSTQLPRVGYLAQRSKPTDTNPDPGAEAFQLGLRELGYVEGKNLLVEYRFGEGIEERLQAHVRELEDLKVKLIVTPGISVVRAVQRVTKTISIVMVSPQTRWLQDSSKAYSGQEATSPV